MKTITNVYLLPSDRVEDGLLLKRDKLSVKRGMITSGGNIQAYQLYITLPQSDLEISKIHNRDWYYSKIHNSIFQCTSDNQYFDSNEEKIIATTDRELREGGTICKLPLIPQSFIEHFITEYNKGNIIKQVEVKLTWAKLRHGDGRQWIKSAPFLKLNQRNEISIVLPEKTSQKKLHYLIDSNFKINNPLDKAKLLTISREQSITIIDSKEKMYSRIEVEDLIYSAMKSRNYTSVQELNDWVKENLK